MLNPSEKPFKFVIYKMINRRSFIQQAVVMAAGTVILPQLSCAGSAPEKRIGLQLYTLRDEIPKDVVKVMERVAASGYQEVEVFGYSPSTHFWGFSPGAFAEILDSNNLKAISGHYDFDEYLGPASKLQRFDAYINAASVLKHRYLTIPYINEKFRTSADDYKKLAEKFNQAGEKCQKSGLQLAYHNHAFEFQQFGETTGYDILLAETDPKLVKFELDLYWVVRAGRDPLELFKKNKGRFELWHVKDMDRRDPALNTEVGSGSIDFKKIFAEAGLSGLKNVIIEQENFSIDPFESISRSAAFTKTNLLPNMR